MAKKGKSLDTRVSRKPLEETEFFDGLQELLNKSDRVSAIVGGALLEYALQELLVSALPRPDDVQGLFHEASAPFGSFSARIKAGHAMGLISDDVRRDLGIIRNVRNQFAHALMNVTFELPAIKAECEKLTNHVDREPHPSRDISTVRWSWERSCIMLHSTLITQAHVKRASVATNDQPVDTPN